MLAVLLHIPQMKVGIQHRHLLVSSRGHSFPSFSYFSFFFFFFLFLKKKKIQNSNMADPESIDSAPGPDDMVALYEVVVGTYEYSLYGFGCSVAGSGAVELELAFATEAHCAPITALTASGPLVVSGSADELMKYVAAAPADWGQWKGKNKGFLFDDAACCARGWAIMGCRACPEPRPATPSYPYEPRHPQGLFPVDS